VAEQSRRAVLDHVLSEVVDSPSAQTVEHYASGLPHPALARCALDYAQFLASFVEGVVWIKLVSRTAKRPQSRRKRL
jgi:hypothetical protein